MTQAVFLCRLMAMVDSEELYYHNGKGDDVHCDVVDVFDLDDVVVPFFSEFSARASGSTLVPSAEMI